MEDKELVHDLLDTLFPFAMAYDYFFLPTDRYDKQLYWFENTVRQGKQHPNLTLFVQDFKRAYETWKRYHDELENQL